MGVNLVYGFMGRVCYSQGKRDEEEEEEEEEDLSYPILIDFVLEGLPRE